MCVVIWKDRRPMTAWEIAIYGRSCGTLLGLVLSDYSFLDVLKILLTFSKTSEIEYGFPFIATKTEVIEADLKGSCVLSKGSLATWEQHILLAQTILQSPETLKFVKGEAHDVLTKRIWTTRCLQLFGTLIRCCSIALSSTTLQNQKDRKGIFLFMSSVRLEHGT